MMSVDLLGDAMNTIKTHEMAGMQKCKVRASRLVKDVLEIFKKNGYVTSYEFVDDGKGGHYKVVLGGFINNCGVIKPRMPVKKSEWIRIEQNYIPGVGVGLIVVSTPKGVATNKEAQEMQVGGKLLAFVY
jgi:small subunit ribosomal protein S8